MQRSLQFDPTFAKYFVNDPVQKPIKEEFNDSSESQSDSSEDHPKLEEQFKNLSLYRQKQKLDTSDDHVFSEIAYTTPKSQTMKINFIQTPSPGAKSSTFPRKKLQMNKSTILPGTDSSYVDSLNQTQYSGSYEQNLSHSKSNSSHSTYECIFPQQQPVFPQFEEQTQPRMDFQYAPQYYYQPPSQQFTQPYNFFKQQYELQKPLTSFQQFHNHQKIVKRIKRKTEYQKDCGQFDVILDQIGNDTRSTLMIKNIPNKYTQEALLKIINQNHAGQFDFFYLPIDFTNKCNVGYAFINFIDCRKIKEFYINFHNSRWGISNSEKICEIKYARIQGKQTLQEHFENSNIMNQIDRKLKPLFLREIHQLVQKQKESASKSQSEFQLQQL